MLPMGQAVAARLALQERGQQWVHQALHLVLLPVAAAAEQPSTPSAGAAQAARVVGVQCRPPPPSSPSVRSMTTSPVRMKN